MWPVRLGPVDRDRAAGSGRIGGDDHEVGAGAPGGRRQEKPPAARGGWKDQASVGVRASAAVSSGGVPSSWVRPSGVRPSGVRPSGVRRGSPARARASPAAALLYQQGHDGKQRHERQDVERGIAEIHAPGPVDAAIDDAGETVEGQDAGAAGAPERQVDRRRDRRVGRRRDVAGTQDAEPAVEIPNDESQGAEEHQGSDDGRGNHARAPAEHRDAGRHRQRHESPQGGEGLRHQQCGDEQLDASDKLVEHARGVERVQEVVEGARVLRVCEGLIEHFLEPRGDKCEPQHDAQVGDDEMAPAARVQAVDEAFHWLSVARPEQSRPPGRHRSAVAALDVVRGLLVLRA